MIGGGRACPQWVARREGSVESPPLLVLVDR
jgi:hypothetical protein